MDWSKAKNIIIAVLLIADLTIGGLLVSRTAAERRQERLAAADTVAFLEDRGMQVQAAVPEKSEKLPVLFVTLQRSEEAAEEQTYKGYPIIVQGSSVDFEVSGSGQQAARTIPASDALLKLYAVLSSEGSVAGKTVEDIELVYLLTSEGTSYAAQDTAIPAWRIRVSGKTYTVSAYEE